MRKEAEVEASAESHQARGENIAPAVAATRCSQTWAILIKRVYEVAPLSCPHCGLWRASAPRAPPDVEDLVLDLDASYSDSFIGSPEQAGQSQELTYVDTDTLLATF